MKITPAAAEVIDAYLRNAGIPHPVVQLVQVSDVPAEIVRAIEQGASAREIRALELRSLPRERRYLCPAVYPRSHFLWIFTTIIQGVRFASPMLHPPPARTALKTGVLDVADRGLLLRDRNGNVVLPRADAASEA
jgi:hypothetical protein